MTSLSFVKDTQVVDGVECGYVIRSPCLLITSQRTVVHHLRIFVTSSNFVEDTQIVDGVECGCVIRSPYLLFTSQRTVVHRLRIFLNSFHSVKANPVFYLL